MSVTYIPAVLRRIVVARSGKRCEYCLCSDAYSAFPFHVDHIIPESKGGTTTEDNLAYSCGCNDFKNQLAEGLKREKKMTKQPKKVDYDELFRLWGFVIVAVLFALGIAYIFGRDVLLIFRHWNNVDFDRVGRNVFDTLLKWGVLSGIFYGAYSYAKERVKDNPGSCTTIGMCKMYLLVICGVALISCFLPSSETHVAAEQLLVERFITGIIPVIVGVNLGSGCFEPRRNR